MRRLALLAALLAAPPAAAQDFAAARPLLQAYCVKCHGPDDKEGGVDFASVTAETAGAKTKLWKRSQKRLDGDEMPPPEAKQPTADERAKLSKLLDGLATRTDRDPAKRDAGPPQLRRLTRTEYANTLRDLLGFSFDAAGAVGLADETRGDGHFDNLAGNLRVSDALLEKYFAAADLALDKLFARGWPGDDARRKLGLTRPDAKTPEADAAKTALTNFLRRAHRRPATPDDVARAVGFFERARAGGAGYEDALRAALKPALVSPRFLFRLEEDRPGTAVSVPVSAHELAVRLSYFLWATMPDDELFRAAEAGELLDPAGYDKQVRRMLRADQAKALTDALVLQWLQVDKLATARPTTEFFPAFNDGLKRAMRQEAEAFVDHLRTGNRSVLELLDADYTFANAELAKHYGLRGVSGDKPQKVPLTPGDHRGGLLGMGAVLALTSHTFRTSPTQRGKYVLEVVFGTPPPPPPPNAGTIADKPAAPPQGGGKPALTFRDQLAAHATQASCAGCHAKIDPLGFALDNYNAVGAWREGTAAAPLDTTGVLPGNVKVGGVAELKTVLLGRKDEFSRNLAGKLLEYALGRELDACDEPTLDDLQAALARDGYAFETLVLEVTRSVPFRQRRAQASGPR